MESMSFAIPAPNQRNPLALPNIGSFISHKPQQPASRINSINGISQLLPALDGQPSESSKPVIHSRQENRPSDAAISTNIDGQTLPPQISITCGQTRYTKDMDGIGTRSSQQIRNLSDRQIGGTQIRNPHRPIECDHCMATFIDKDELLVHSRLYHSRQSTNETYKCEKCVSVFGTFQELVDHNTSTHKRGPKRGSKMRRRTKDLIMATRASQYVDQMKTRKKRNIIRHRHSALDVIKEEMSGSSQSSNSCSATSVDEEQYTSEEEEEDIQEEEDEADDMADINQILMNLNGGTMSKSSHKSSRPHTSKQVKQRSTRSAATFNTNYGMQRGNSNRNHIAIGTIAKEAKNRAELQRQGFRPSRWRHSHKGVIQSHQCPYCPYGTNSSAHLKYHVMIHTGEKPFECRFCKKKFRQKSHMQVHISKHHPNEW